MVVSNDLPYDLIVLHVDFKTSSTTTTAATATKSYNNDKERKKQQQKKGDVSLMEAFKVLGFMGRKCDFKSPFEEEELKKGYFGIIQIGHITSSWASFQSRMGCLAILLVSYLNKKVC